MLGVVVSMVGAWAGLGRVGSSAAVPPLSRRKCCPQDELSAPERAQGQTPARAIPGP